jgi:hypothetical protein
VRRSDYPDAIKFITLSTNGDWHLTLEKPTKPMRDEAVEVGRYESKLWHDKDYPKIQLLTIEGLLSGNGRVNAPPQVNPFAKAQREAKLQKQTELIWALLHRS